MDKEEKSFKVYVTDALMAIAENTTHLAGHQGIIDYGRVINQRWYDMINPSIKEEPEDHRSSEEIAADIWSRIRGQ